ncbi:MAG: ferredoxin [Eubacteriales bacterium]|nr:ferredoxin [Eubacteriales bacterium]
MNVLINRAGCIGCGTCEALCPEVYQIQEDGLAQIIAQPDGYLEDAAREAAGSCPVSVIEVEEE